LDEANSRRVGGGGGGGTTHISTMESSDVSSWHDGGGAMRLRLELATSWCKGGGPVWRRLELPTSWHEGGGAMQLEGEANLPWRSWAYLFAISECLLIMANLMLKKQQHV
jgi:hypothetical protein